MTSVFIYLFFWAVHIKIFFNLIGKLCKEKINIHPMVVDVTKIGRKWTKNELENYKKSYNCWDLQGPGQKLGLFKLK